MERSPSWEAHNHRLSQGISRILRNPEVHCHFHNSPPPVPILSHINPIHTFPHYFPNMHSNIIFPSMISLPSGLFPSGHPTELLYAFLFSPMHATYPAHLILPHWMTRIIFGEDYKL